METKVVNIEIRADKFANILMQQDREAWVVFFSTVRRKVCTEAHKKRKEHKTPEADALEDIETNLEALVKRLAYLKNLEEGHKRDD